MSEAIYRYVLLNQTGWECGKSGLSWIPACRSAVQPTSRDPRENHPIYRVFRHKEVWYSETYLYMLAGFFQVYLCHWVDSPSYTMFVLVSRIFQLDANEISLSSWELCAWLVVTRNYISSSLQQLFKFGLLTMLKCAQIVISAWSL